MVTSGGVEITKGQHQNYLKASHKKGVDRLKMPLDKAKTSYENLKTTHKKELDNLKTQHKKGIGKKKNRIMLTRTSPQC